MKKYIPFILLGISLILMVLSDYISSQFLSKSFSDQFFRINKMFAIVFFVWVLMKVFKLKRFDE